MDRIDRKKLFKTLAYLIFIIFILHFLANKFFWYYSVWYFDMIMHALGGFWVGLLAFFIFPPADSFWGVIQKVMLFVILVGAGWEVYEFLVNDIIAKNPIDFLDTFSDLFFDLFGGLCAILYILVPLKNQQTDKKE